MTETDPKLRIREVLQKQRYRTGMPMGELMRELGNVSGDISGPLIREMTASGELVIVAGNEDPADEASIYLLPGDDYSCPNQGNPVPAAECSGCIMCSYRCESCRKWVDPGAVGEQDEADIRCIECGGTYERC